MSQSVVTLLEAEISRAVTEIWLEYPYVDKDFRATWYNDLSKRFQEISRDSIRLHLFYKPGRFTSENYAGFITLRDTAEFTLGRSYISPRALEGFTSGYCALARYPVQFRGMELEVAAFPWMQQDGNVSRCAHIAAWSIIRYFSQKYTYYPEKTLHEITAYDSNIRQIPSRGATVDQIAQILRRNRFEPDIYFRKITGRDAADNKKASRLFERILYTVIESGIPFVAGLQQLKHAVAVVGHGPPTNPDDVFGQNDGIVDSALLVTHLLISDDNHLPYRPISSGPQKGQTTIDNIDVAIVPFSQPMYLDVQVLFDEILPRVETHMPPGPADKTLIRRVFLTSSNSFKKTLLATSKDAEYREKHLDLQMPRFIWVVEYATIAEYRKKRVSARMLFDATLLNFASVQFISYKTGNELCVCKANGTAPEIIQLAKKTEPRYENNLQAVVVKSGR